MRARFFLVVAAVVQAGCTTMTIVPTEHGDGLTVSQIATRTAAQRFERGPDGSMVYEVLESDQTRALDVWGARELARTLAPEIGSTVREVVP